MSPPRPALPSRLVVRDDRLDPTRYVTDGVTARLVIVTGRRCTVCEAWAADYVQLRHADGCLAGDVQ